jgi:hypothetical protein
MATKLALFTKHALSEVPIQYRQFWDIGGRDVFKSDNPSYGCRDALGIAQILRPKGSDIDIAVGDFTLIKF